MLWMRFQRSSVSPYTTQLSGCFGRLERARNDDVKHLILNGKLHSDLNLPRRNRSDRGSE